MFTVALNVDGSQDGRVATKSAHDATRPLRVGHGRRVRGRGRHDSRRIARTRHEPLVMPHWSFHEFGRDGADTNYAK